MKGTIRNVLVVGGAGYIGGYAVDYLSQHYNIIVYDNLNYERQYLKPINLVRGDVRQHNKLKDLLDWADAVVWLAAVVGDKACDVDPIVTRAVNVEAVTFLAENFNGRIVFPSTCSVYGAQDALLDEDSPVNPLSLYAESKYEAEKKLSDKNVAVFRLGTLFGLGDCYSRLRFDLVANLFVAKAYLGQELTILGGLQWRPMLHVRDVAPAIDRALRQKHVGIYNLVYENVQIADLAYTIQDHIDGGVIMHWGQMPAEDARNYRVSGAKFENTFKWQPCRTLIEGLQALWVALQEGRIKNPNDPIYHNYRYLSEGDYV